MFFSNWNKEPDEEKIYRWTEFFHKLDNSGWKMHTGARARKQKYICIDIYISIWKPFWKRVYEGWRSGESTHLSPMWLEFKSRHRSHMRFSPLLRDVFPWYIYSGFPLSGKPTFPKSNCTRNVDVLPLIVVYYLLIDLFNNKVENGSHYFDLRYAVDRCCSSSA